MLLPSLHWCLHWTKGRRVLILKSQRIMAEFLPNTWEADAHQSTVNWDMCICPWKERRCHFPLFLLSYRLQYFHINLNWSGTGWCVGGVLPGVNHNALILWQLGATSSWDFGISSFCITLSKCVASWWWAGNVHMSAYSNITHCHVGRYGIIKGANSSWLCLKDAGHKHR